MMLRGSTIPILSLWNWQLISCMTMVIMLMHSPLGTMGMDIGVCYGMQGNNLPPPSDVIGLYKRYEIGKLRLFDPNPSALEALRGSNIRVTLGVRNEDIPNLASGIEAANSWFAQNMAPYINNVSFESVSVGNEVVPGPYASYIAPAMRNLDAVLRFHNLQSISVATTVAALVLQNTYPPSASQFTPESRAPLVDILNFLSSKGSSALMVNLYPYFAYAADPADISLDYAQFTSNEAVFNDGNLSYFNLFDAMVDGVYWAMEKVNAPNVGVVVAESGWPSDGRGSFTSPQLASAYNSNFVRHILSKKNTPKRPGARVGGFLFAMFNENLKPAGEEQHWGLFYPNMQPVYPVFPSKLN